MNGLALSPEAQMQQQLAMVEEMQKRERRQFAVGAAVELAKLQPSVYEEHEDGPDAAWIVRQAKVIEDYIESGVRGTVAKS